MKQWKGGIFVQSREVNFIIPISKNPEPFLQLCMWIAFSVLLTRISFV